MSLIHTSPEQKAKDKARMEFYNVEAAGLNKPHVPISEFHETAALNAQSETRPVTERPTAHAVKANGFVFIQGQVGVDPVTLQAAQGIRQQTVRLLTPGESLVWR